MGKNETKNCAKRLINDTELDQKCAKNVLHCLRDSINTTLKVVPYNRMKSYVQTCVKAKSLVLLEKLRSKTVIEHSCPFIRSAISL